MSFLERYRSDPAVCSEATLETVGLRDSLYLHWDTPEGRGHVLRWPTLRPRPLLPCLRAFWDADDVRWHDLVKASDMRSPVVRQCIAARWRTEGPTQAVVSSIYLVFDGVRGMSKLMKPWMPDFLRRSLYEPIAEYPVFLLDVWIAYGPFDTDEHTSRLGDILLSPLCSSALNVAGRFAPHLRPRAALEHIGQRSGTLGQEARRLLA